MLNCTQTFLPFTFTVSSNLNIEFESCNSLTSPEKKTKIQSFFLATQKWHAYLFTQQRDTFTVGSKINHTALYEGLKAFNSNTCD